MTTGAVLLVAALFAQVPPAIPVGLDAYLQWEKWPQLRIGMRTYMRSTYDRSGGNEGADASHFLYGEGEEFHVTLDEEGPGILCFARYNHWHGSPWHYEVDGVDHIVRETSTADPLHPAEGSVFIPEHLFPNPLTWTWSTTKGADLMWVPIPFEKSFRMAYSRTRYGTGYYIFQRFVPGIPLSTPIKSWDGKAPPDAKILDLLSRAGEDIAPTNIERITAEFDGKHVTAAMPLAELNGPSTIRALKLSVPESYAADFGKARIRLTWDNRAEPSVEAPVALFFGAGALYNRDGREYLVKAFPVNIRYADGRVHLACYFPMPFFVHARVELLDVPPLPEGSLSVEIRHEPLEAARNQVGYFHATYRDHPTLAAGRDVLLLDTRETEGGGDWAGAFIGTSFIFSHRGILNTLEGDPRFFFDDCQTPNYGTGTEEWAGGGDYWGGLNMTLPMAGHPVGARKPEEAKDPLDLIESAYRFLLADMMPFGFRAVIRLEHGATNESTEHYETVTYWYGMPSPSLVLTDELDVGDVDSERTHEYHSPDASDPETIHSRYEWGVDTLPHNPNRTSTDTDNRVEIYPGHHEDGRRTTGASEFTLRTRPDNCGVLLRRSLDYSLPNQRANVYVQDEKHEWQYAGDWYEAGSNTCYYSNPRGELDPPKPVIQQSNRRFRDDEFLIPLALTEGRDSIRLRIEFTPFHRPLLPDSTPADTAWSELRYRTYSFIVPNATGH